MVVVNSYDCLVVTCLNNEGTTMYRGQIPSEMCSIKQHVSRLCLFVLKYIVQVFVGILELIVFR